jgi:signal recognition particle subunit SEC65
MKKGRKLSELIHNKNYTELADALEDLRLEYQMERTRNELSRRVVSEHNYYLNELELAELYNMILIIEDILNQREP